MADADLDNLRPGAITIHRPEDFEGMRRAGRLAAQCLDMLTEHVAPGVRTDHLDRLALEFMLDHGGVPATIGYKGYRHASCISINHVICHGIPSEKTLKDGDILNIDVTVIVDGWHGDTSRMFYAGEPKVKARRLVETTYAAMMAGIEAIRPGATLRDIGRAIQTLAEGEGFSVVRDFCGHGLGRVFHAPPNVVHYAEYKDRLAGVQRAPDTPLKPGMFFTVEPMVNEGRPDAKILKDGWTAVTRDKSLSAQFEHSVGVTENGVEIFTKSPKGLDKPPYR
ncbi:type I methionyl aminopeptidase [Amphiplicatus metriothermophilus]|uniref:Methionine aminopeptidase n=1 Tax=Amphiplicatus metriothermophilus TaxID=1519374 RepID=A0A239Q035_9PROT|nr:type I methionyl aminopeptidase [Amphiplicatus metriothermophilus]MBB5520033.1 methionyl aminopeptidase [Amphiplicatus metriothermophilus]SNT75790.1 methionine aminopeptidase, type I [Amphiplicatus metriothermophilus]